MADTEAKAGDSETMESSAADANGVPAPADAPVAVAATEEAPAVSARKDEPEDGAPVLAPLVSEATGARENRTGQKDADADAKVGAAPAEASAEPAVSEALSIQVDEPAPAQAAKTEEPVVALAEASADSDSGRVAAPVFDVDSGLDGESGPAVVGAQAAAALAALDSAPNLSPPVLDNDDRTVITSSPPVHDLLAATPADLPLAPEGTQPGAELEVLGVTDVSASLSRDTIRTTESPIVATNSTLSHWAESARPRRRSTLEVVRKLAARRVDVSGLQLGAIVFVAGLAGGLVSRAVAGGGRAAEPVVAVAAAEATAPAAPGPTSHPTVTPLPAPEPVAAPAPAKPAKVAKAARKRTLASAAGAKPTTAKH